MDTAVTERPMPTGEGLTFEKVWAMFQETDKKIQKIAEERERRERSMAESAKRLDKQLGKLGGRFGEMVEYMVLPNLVKKFRKLGFVFTKAYPQALITDEEHSIFAEVDITLENGDKMMFVEVKTKPNTRDITDHVSRMKKLRAHGDKHNDTRKYLGAIAGMVFNDNVKKFALKNGFCVIEPSGETFIIIAPEGDNSLREW